MSNLFLRSLEEPVNANEEKDAGLGHTEHVSLQEKPQPSDNRWLKYIARGSRELEPEAGACFNRRPSSTTEKPDPPFNTSLPRKRRWSQSTAQPLCSPDGQDLGDSEVTLETQKVVKSSFQCICLLSGRGRPGPSDILISHEGLCAATSTASEHSPRFWTCASAVSEQAGWRLHPFTDSLSPSSSPLLSVTPLPGSQVPMTQVPDFMRISAFFGKPGHGI